MKNMMSSDSLRAKIKELNVKSNKGQRSGNLRGIGVESMSGIADSAKISRNKARILKKMSPTLDRGLQILAGMISCPEGGVRTNINYNLGTFDGISDEKTARILTAIKRYVDVELDIESTLQSTVYKIISEVGADVEVYIPIDLLDDMVGLESTGYIDKNTTEIEYDPKTYIHTTNNVGALLMSAPTTKDVVGNEAATNTRSRLSRINKTTMALSKTDVLGANGVIVRKTTGASVIPIMYNGRVIKYVGLFDEMGGFVTQDDNVPFGDLMDGTTSDSEKSQYEILNREAKVSNSSIRENGIYKDIRTSIENDIVSAILEDKNDTMTSHLIESMGEENVLDILISRAMAEKKTRVIMLDPDYVSYMSLIENDNGRGITVIEDNSSIILLHVTLLYAKILAELESSIPSTVVTATLDENDMDADATLNDIQGELATSVLKDYQLDYSGNRNLFRSLSRMNTSFKIENANIDGMPNMDIDIDRKQDRVDGPSTDILELVGKFATQGIGISAEHVDNSYSEKFKLQVSRDNDITARQMNIYVRSVNAAITDRARKRIVHNNDLWNELTSIIGAKDSDDKLIDLLGHLSLELPEGTTSKFDTLAQNLDVLTTAVADYVEKAIPDTIIDNGSRIDADSLDTMREMVEGAFIRAYAANTDLFGGLGMDLTSMDGIASVINGELEDYGDAFKKMTKGIVKFNKKVNKATDKVEGGEEEETPPEQDVAPPTEEDTPPQEDVVPPEEDTPPEEELGDGDIPEFN